VRFIVKRRFLAFERGNIRDDVIVLNRWVRRRSTCEPSCLRPRWSTETELVFVGGPITMSALNDSFTIDERTQGANRMR
jgi:hypothetical protein